MGAQPFPHVREVGMRRVSSGVERRSEEPSVRGSIPRLAAKFLDWLIGAKNFTVLTSHCYICKKALQIKVKCDKCPYGAVKCLGYADPFCLRDNLFFCGEHRFEDALDQWESHDFKH